MSKTLEADDFMKMTHQRLLAYWLIYSSDAQGHIGAPSTCERNICSFEAHGREVVCGILGMCNYPNNYGPIREVPLVEAKEILRNMRKSNDYRIFSVGFVKRSDQTYRKMLCRYGVKKGLKGGEKAFNDEDYDLSTVWDTQAPPKLSKAQKIAQEDGHVVDPGTPGGYRSIPLEGLITFKIGGQEYVVIENKDLLAKLNS